MSILSTSTFLALAFLSETGDGIHNIPFVGHKQIITALAFSPDGKFLASGEVLNSTVFIWSVAERKVISRLTGLPPNIDPDTKFEFPFWPRRLEFARDGNTVVASNHGFVAGWIPAKSARVFERVLDDQKKKISPDLTAVCVDPRGGSIIAGIDNELREMSLDKGNDGLLKRLEAKEVFATLGFAPNGKTLFTWTTAPIGGKYGFSSKHGGALYEYPNMKELSRFHGKDLAPPLIHCFCPDGELIATGSPDGTVAIWDSTTGKELDRKNPDESWIKGLGYNERHKLLIAATQDGTIWIYDVNARKCVKNGKFDDINAMALSPDGKVVAIGFGNGRYRDASDPVNQGILKLFEFENLLK